MSLREKNRHVGPSWLLRSAHLPPTGPFPARALHSDSGRTPHTPHDCVNLISSARAGIASSGGRAAPVMSSRNARPADAGRP
eukprot:12515876-Alexandrium_andersonii.AAC.1